MRNRVTDHTATPRHTKKTAPTGHCLPVTKEKKPKRKLSIGDAQAYCRSSNDPIWDSARSSMVAPGYVVLTVYDHVLHGYLDRREHIVVWERCSGEKVPEGWVIHHFDEMKSNNHPENLVALPRGLHRELHWVLEREKGSPDYLLRRSLLTENMIKRSTALTDLRRRWRQDPEGDDND